MTSEHTAPERPMKKSKSAIFGPGLSALGLARTRLQLPNAFTPASVQSNRLALLLVSLDITTGGLTGRGPEIGKEGVLVPCPAEPGHVRQLECLSLAAEVQGLYAGVHGGYQVLAAVDSVGNARMLASALPAASSPSSSLPLGGLSVSDHGGSGLDDGGGDRHLLCLDARSRGEAGWTGLALRTMQGQHSAEAGAAAAAEGGGDGGGQGLPALEVAVARQRRRDVSIFRDGAHCRTLHMTQGPTALTYLPTGSSDPAGGLLAVAEEHQVTLWDVRQGEQGGCVQRLGVYGGGSSVLAMSWVAAAGQPGGGMLACTGAERSVVVLEPRKWQVSNKWPGCVKYPATHMAASAAAPGYVYVAGLDYECVAGRWDGSSGGSTGNSNSTSGGHGRATGPQQLLAAAGDEGQEGSGSRAGLSFRGDSKWLGLKVLAVPPTHAGGSCSDLVAALSQSGNLFVLQAAAAAV
ncbi:hypothetical protein TSOC_000053 [Tetrabaena socialis]|uniref:Uncharacterized protein n=1 Tax=Tetrabaena socialis TaxID=47790 RepID=A0A2J8AKE2_9CHLO|nr:hypothetical protein TSOC_000053 [Tetrabaena socialis]|eukprot:PNH12987.1 hypothetical protein TSOC_000053 [Tetrabaena socialis]